MEEAYLEYNHMVIRYQCNLNLIKDLDGCDVLGKSNLFLLERWSGNYDYTLLFLPQDKLSLDFQDEVITLYGDLEYLKRTTMIQVIVFLLYQRKKCLNGIISFHAAAVLYRDTLILFMGPKGSGKTSLSYYFSQKYEDIRLIANDYLEIELDFNRGAFTVVASDFDKTITFRSHVLYHLDHALYQKNTGTDEFIFDKPIKVAGEFADIKNESIQCQKLVFLHVGLGKTKELDVSFKSEAALNLELYKELVHYLRGSSVVAIENRIKIVPCYFNNQYFYHEGMNQIINNILYNLTSSPLVDIAWLRGDLETIVAYIQKKYLSSS